MREPVSGINPKLLVWARHRCGQSIEEVAQALGKQPEVIESWEAGIYLNNSTAVTRQIFTLFHELAHILSRTGGVTKLDDRYIGALSGEAKRIEVFCNRFAAELLVPVADFRRRIQGLSFSDETIATLAGEFKVSREVILRRLRDLDLVCEHFGVACTNVEGFMAANDWQF